MNNMQTMNEQMQMAQWALDMVEDLIRKKATVDVCCTTTFNVCCTPKNPQNQLSLPPGLRRVASSNNMHARSAAYHQWIASVTHSSRLMID